MSWGEPLLVDDLEVPSQITPLLRLRSNTKDDQKGYREALLQRLVHAAPECLPIKGIDTAFLGLKSVCCELPLHEAVGRYADNLLINSDGRLCLVECKLATNAESDRDVLAQLIDYAAALSRLDYAGLADRVRRAVGMTTGDPIIEAVLGKDASADSVEDLFVGIERYLRRGEILLLIVGDRIRPHTVQLVELLQERVSLGFTFGLVEMPVYATSNGYVVFPRVLLRTEVVKRTMFMMSDSTRDLKVQRIDGKEPAGSLGEMEFFAGLAAINPIYPDAVRQLLGRLVDLGCETRLLRKYNVYLDDGLGGRLNVLSLTPTGTVEVWGTASRDAQLGEPAGRDYMLRLAAHLPGGRLNDSGPDHASWNLRVNDRIGIPLSLLLVHEADWLASVSALRDRLLALQRRADAR